jgi:RNA polymerase sigma-70 factor (ECF subfamily)
MSLGDVAASIDRATLRWPGLVADPEGFRQHVGSLAVSPSSLDSYGHELYLTFACRRLDPHALRVLEREYIGSVAPVIVRVNSAPDFVDEVSQAVRSRLLAPPKPKIGRYAAKGSLQAWIRVLTLRVALDQHKAHRKREEVLFDALIEPVSSDPSGTEPYREAIQEALCAALEALSTRERNVLRLHYVETVTLDQIATLYGTHRATAARWLARARQRIFDCVAADVQARLAVTRSEVNSILADVRSQLDVSVFRLLIGSAKAEELSSVHSP